MNMLNSNHEFGLISKLLHWLIAVSMIGLIPMGWYMTGLSDEDVLYWRLFDLHLALGLGLCVLVALKFAWLYFSRNPSSLPELASWERRSARAVYIFFLAAMVLIPLSGILFVASNGEPIELYSLITIPDIGQFSKAVRGTLSDIHYYLSYGCAALITVHMFAALKHHYMDLNNSLRRISF